MNNLQTLFPEFYQDKLKSEDLKATKNNIIVFDTNYLLDILRYPTSIATKYLEALDKVSDNLYIPYLVALEFNFQKSNIKKRKKQQIEDYKNLINNSTANLIDNISKIELIKDTSDKENFTSSLIEKTTQFQTELKNAIDNKIKITITKEEQNIYEKLIKIISNKIGDKYPQEEIDAIEKEGKIRYSEGIPPGYNDSEKENNGEETRKYDNIKYQTQYGDLIIWKDIIKYSKKQKLATKVIFITNDGTSKKKNDLMYRVGSMTVGPHISLLNELRAESDKELYILSNLNFIKLVSELTDAEINNLKVSTSLENDLDQKESDISFTQRLYNKLLAIDGENPEELTSLDQLISVMPLEDFLRYKENEEYYKEHLESIITYLNRDKKTFPPFLAHKKNSSKTSFGTQNRGNWFNDLTDNT